MPTMGAATFQLRKNLLLQSQAQSLSGSLYPSGPNSLMPLSSHGLWLAEITMPVSKAMRRGQVRDGRRGDHTRHSQSRPTHLPSVRRSTSRQSARRTPAYPCPAGAAATPPSDCASALPMANTVRGSSGDCPATARMPSVPKSFFISVRLETLLPCAAYRIQRKAKGGRSKAAPGTLTKTTWKQSRRDDFLRSHASS